MASIGDTLKSEETKHGQYVRVQLSLRSEFAERLERLRRKSGVASYAEVVRDALKRHDQIEQLLGPDDKLCIERSDGSRTYLLL